MKLGLTLAFLFLSFGCGQVFNSHSNDQSIYSANCADPSDLGFEDSCQVIKARCISCHTGYHNSWASYKTSQAYITNGLIVAGDPAGSQLIYRMKNFQGGASSNMPLSNPQIPDVEYETLFDWVQNL